MLSLKRIFKNYDETGSFNELVNLYGFIDANLFLTKTGAVGTVLELRGVDYECLDGQTVDYLTKRLESALKLFDENFRIYQYLFKRNNERIPHKLYANPVVNAAIRNRIAHLEGKADHLFSLSLYFVVLFEGTASADGVAGVFAGLADTPMALLKRLWTRLSSERQILFLDRAVSQAQAALRQKVESFILQLSDFVAVRLLDK